MSVLPYALLGGGVVLSGAAAALVLGLKSAATARETEKAIGTGGTINVRLTGYWPFVKGLSAKERKMEGGVNDRKGHPLHTLEMYQRDPVAHPYVSVAGDDAAWPYGQRIAISAWPGVVFRVVDTGSHFRGTGKLYRASGREPLDVCVESSSTVVPKSNTTATIFPGDHFAKKGLTDVATSKFQGQTVAGDDSISSLYLMGSDLIGAPDEISMPVMATAVGAQQPAFTDIVDPLDALKKLRG